MSDNVKPPDPIDWNSYEDGGGGKPLPPTGEYELEVASIQTTDSDGRLLRNKEGYFQATIDLKVIAPGQPYDGFLSRFNRFNTKRWPNKNASGLADLLRGAGVTTPLQTDDEYARAVNAIKGRRIRAMLDWEAYDGPNGVSVKGMSAFPSDKDGKKLSKINVKGQDYFANVRVKYVVSAVKR